MSWDYRIIQKQSLRDETENGIYYEVHEAYYNSEDELCLISKEPISPYGMSLDGLKWTLEFMRKACDKPILIDGQIEFAPDIDEHD